MIPRQPRGTSAFAVSVILHVVIGAALLRVLTIPNALNSLFSSWGQPAPVERIGFLALPRSAAPSEAPRAGGNIGNRVIKGIQTYVRECFSIPFYWWLYLASACYTMATVPFITFRLLLAKDLGMDLGQAGDLVSWIFVGGVVLYLPLGWLADKVHPLRLNFIGVMLTFIVLTLSSLLVHSPASFWLFTLLWAVAWLCFTASGPAMVFLLLPRERFGQFGSAIAISGSIAGALANYGGGRFVDWLGAIHVAGSPYRGVFWWGAAFSGMSLVCMVMLYRGWLARGGRKHFVAPKI